MPLFGGVKVLGQLGNWDLALLDTIAKETSVTHGNPNGVDDNLLVGADLLWRTASFRGDKNLSLGAWASW